MSGKSAAELRAAAHDARREGASLMREADRMDREAAVLELHKVVFDTGDAVLNVTQAQLHFIYTKAFAAEGIGSVGVERERGCLIVQYGDERDFINDVGDVVKHEGFDPFDSDWKAL